MMSAKELNYVKDLLSRELPASKKCNEYGRQEGNSPQQQIFADAASIHQQNYPNHLFTNLFDLGEYQANIATAAEIADAADTFSNYQVQLP